MQNFFNLIQFSSNLNSFVLSFIKLGYAPFSRPRLNSVFVGPHHLLSPPQPPRKTKSAFDIHSLTEAECEV